MCNHDAIPQVEIGSFVAQQPDKSEFIGSASGVYFVNTVFRAFAASSPPPSSTAVDQADSVGAGATAGAGRGEDTNLNPSPDPNAAHTCVVATDDVQDPEEADDLEPAGASGDAASAPKSYGIIAPGMGGPPSPALATKLVMFFFRHWHPFFPFLHGPTFFKELNDFFEGNSDNCGLDLRPHLDQRARRARTCRAVLFQCIFDIAASSIPDKTELGSFTSIQSTLALTNQLGVISSGSEISALQAMLAMELCLITRMSLRAASTVHGTVTRMLYHAGFHRCPHRYVQMPRHMCEIRQRIFWCAYVLDRFVSQSLGHPLAFDDAEIDTCIPGMTELHQPVMPSQVTMRSQTGPSENYRAHLPRDHPSTGSSQDPSTPKAKSGGGEAVLGTPNGQSPAHHHSSSSEAVGQYVLSYYATYSRIAGDAMRMLHCSIHSREITREKVLDLTCRIHAWWNSLPLSLQDDDGNPRAAGPNSTYGAFFALLYNSLLLFINRPFLSLPTNRSDFRASLQAAVSAGRAIINKLKYHSLTSILMVWPGVLSAVWMSGLVLSFATLLELYPFAKANLELEYCMSLLRTMSRDWASARRCQMALGMLHERLQRRFEGKNTMMMPVPAILPHQLPQPDPVEPSASRQSQGTPAPTSATNKRKRQQDDEGRSRFTNQAFGYESPFNGIPSQGPIWQPVLEYTGPDFGFDSDQFNSEDDWQGLLAQGLAQDSSGLYSTSMWQAYVQGVGDNWNF